MQQAPLTITLVALLAGVAVGCSSAEEAPSSPATPQAVTPEEDAGEAPLETPSETPDATTTLPPDSHVYSPQPVQADLGEMADAWAESVRAGDMASACELMLTNAGVPRLDSPHGIQECVDAYEPSRVKELADMVNANGGARGPQDDTTSPTWAQVGGLPLPVQKIEGHWWMGHGLMSR